MIYHIDADKTFFDDQEDEDFTEYSMITHEIIKAVYDGKRQAYEYWSGNAISADSAKSMMNQVDTVYVENPETKSMEKKVVVVSYEKDIPSIKIKEQWYLEKDNLQLKKKVLAIAPRVPVYSKETGELRGYSPLFWIFLDQDEEKKFLEELDS